MCIFALVSCKHVLKFTLKDKPQFLYTKLCGPSHGIFVGCIALKAMLQPLVYVMLTFIICQKPIQQILHVLLTVGYKFVNDFENWFLLLWL